MQGLIRGIETKKTNHKIWRNQGHVTHKLDVCVCVAYRGPWKKGLNFPWVSVVLWELTSEKELASAIHLEWIGCQSQTLMSAKNILKKWSQRQQYGLACRLKRTDQMAIGASFRTTQKRYHDDTSHFGRAILLVVHTLIWLMTENRTKDAVWLVQGSDHMATPHK